METDTIRRIVCATVELHAEKGALATTHADIAARAGVAVTTVYKHFPSRESLLPHCTGMVMQQAPQIDARAILGLRTRNEKLSRLVQALHQQYRYFHPWMQWVPGDAPSLPVLAEITEASQKQTEEFVRDVLNHIVGTPLNDESFALAMVMLDYAAWQRLGQMLDDPERVTRAAEQALQLLMSKLR